MEKQFSAGIVVFHEIKKQREYLLLHYQSGHWDFPKGHIEKGETKHEAALRELQEETGLSATILDGFEQSFSYMFKIPKTKELVHKTVYFFVGKTDETQVTLSHEHIGSEWLSYKKALDQLTYTNAQELLESVERFLNESGQ